MWYTLVCVFLYLHISAAKKPLCSVFFLFFGQCLDVIFYTKSLKTGIQKHPCMSLKNISMTTFIDSLISAYDSTAQGLAARINQKWPLLDQKWELYDTTLIRWTY